MEYFLPVITRVCCGVAVVGLLLFPPFASAREPGETAELQVRGLGFLGNRSLMRTLEILHDADGPPAFYDANQIEDAALILLARLQQDGYLRPEVEAELTLEDGGSATYVWNETLDTLLPRPVRATAVAFTVHSGILFAYERIEFEGLTAIDEDEAREFFIATGFLFDARRARRFTPGGLEDGLANLREVLVRRGYEGARVAASRVDRNDETGDVTVLIGVTEGPRSIIGSVRTGIAGDGEREARRPDVPAEQPYSRIWTQDYAQELRREYYRRGYPDTEVTVSVENRVPGAEEVVVDLLFTVDPGPYVEMGEVLFRGHDKTRESVLRRRVGLKRGDPLNRVEVDEARYRLARLGIFDFVDVELEEREEGIRNVVFDLREGREIDINLLFGYGSYEMFRAGLEVEQFNIFGRAHRSRLLLVQSMRSSSFNYRYTVPELFGEEIHGFSSAFALRREERDFVRLEYGGSVGAQTLFHRVDTEATLRYTYQLMEARGSFSSDLDGLERAMVGAVALDLNRDQRDNPIYPERGLNIFTHFEVASELFAGEVNYQRMEVGSTYHRGIGGGRYVHAGFRHGAIHTFGDVANEIPFSRRFLMGGENSVRGFLQGQASARNEEGAVVGSETYMLLNIEMEQALTPRWSAVLFSDSIGFARRIGDYPFDETLYSVGVGIRYKTLIGPIRLEYGHNLNPRPRDPNGAIHLSIGFPF